MADKSNTEMPSQGQDIACTCSHQSSPGIFYAHRVSNWFLDTLHSRQYYSKIFTHQSTLAQCVDTIIQGL